MVLPEEQLVIVEGMIIGMISWVLGALLPMPIAKGLGYVLGGSLWIVPLEYWFSMDGLIIWLMMVVLLPRCPASYRRAILSA